MESARQTKIESLPQKQARKKEKVDIFKGEYVRRALLLRCVFPGRLGLSPLLRQPLQRENSFMAITIARSR